MLHGVSIIVAAGLLVAAGPEEKAGLDELQGSWKLVQVQINGPATLGFEER